MNVLDEVRVHFPVQILVQLHVAATEGGAELAIAHGEEAVDANHDSLAEVEVRTAGQVFPVHLPYDIQAVAPVTEENTVHTLGLDTLGTGVKGIREGISPALFSPVSQYAPVRVLSHGAPNSPFPSLQSFLFSPTRLLVAQTQVDTLHTVHHGASQAVQVLLRIAVAEQAVHHLHVGERAGALVVADGTNSEVQQGTHPSDVPATPSSLSQFSPSLTPSPSVPALAYVRVAVLDNPRIPYVTQAHLVEEALRQTVRASLSLLPFLLVYPSPYQALHQVLTQQATNDSDNVSAYYSTH